MPAGDGSGPEGRGSMSGRGTGYCSGSDAPGWANPVRGRGYGRAYGRAYGPGRRGGGGGAWGGRGGRGGRFGGQRQQAWGFGRGAPRRAGAGYGYGRGRFADPGWGPAPDWVPEPDWIPEARWGSGPYAAAPSREEETNMLRQQAEWLKQELDAIDQRIGELGSE